MTGELSGALLIVFGFIAFVASLPQLVRLVRLKDSREFSALSWFFFLLYQASSLAYAVAISSLPYVVLNIVWVVFYALMFGLVVRYSKLKP